MACHPPGMVEGAHQALAVVASVQRAYFLWEVAEVATVLPLQRLNQTAGGTLLQGRMNNTKWTTRLVW